MIGKQCFLFTLLISLPEYNIVSGPETLSGVTVGNISANARKKITGFTWWFGNCRICQ